MTITKIQLLDAINNANVLGNSRDALTLIDMRNNLRCWGRLTPRQVEFAKVLIERNSAEKCAIQEDNKKEHQDKWVGDYEYKSFLMFLARFFASSSQSAYGRHISNRSDHASRVLKTLEGEIPSWSDCNSLLTSKLAPRLGQTYDATPLYAIGDLVRMRSGETTGWEYSNGWLDEMGIIAEIDPMPVNTVATYHKTKGGTRFYDIMFPSGRRMKCENQLKLVSRKHRNKGKSCK